MTVLGSDWVPDAEGIPHREAARVVIFSPSGELLLLKGRDGHDPHHQWWFTVGGGIEPGEGPRAAAVREVSEEIGLALNEEQLVGPVLYRNAEFLFHNVRARQDEWFFLAFLDREIELDQRGRTEDEKFLLKDEGWFGPEALEQLAQRERVYPELLPTLARRWRQGWDGELLRLQENGE